ncbi:MAG: hypothetical protein JWL81_2756 [Verrucomicrobiales bacterium]|nr:hypothetical protein [Verrucomicrobiales bacterium]
MKSVLTFFMISTASVFAGDNAVPDPVSAADFTALFERPPFRRILGLSDSLVLSGVASVPGGKMVTVWNRSSGESFVVTATPNSQGWKLKELSDSRDLKRVEAVIVSGEQSITLRFDPERLTPPRLDNLSKPGARSESQVVVEALLRGLDPAAAKAFESLPPEAQEEFRKSFAGFLSTYPAAGDPQRLEFVRRTLAEATPEPAEVPAAGTPAAPAPGAPPANATQPAAPETAPANPSAAPSPPLEPAPAVEVPPVRPLPNDP